MQGWEAPSLGLIATLLLRASGAKLIWTAHNTFERRSRALDSARVLPALSRETIVHTEADRDRVSRPPTVIPHGHYGGIADVATPVDPAQARADLGLPADGLVVLLFGVLRPDKGLGDLLAAAAEAPPWLVLIAGEDHGGLASAAQWLASPRLSGRVTVLEGFQPIDAVARVFAAADLVALPYRRASQSGVLHLAYGFGRMVAAYPVGGLTEAVIPGVTGWICGEATPMALARVLGEAGALGRPSFAGSAPRRASGPSRATTGSGSRATPRPSTCARSAARVRGSRPAEAEPAAMVAIRHGRRRRHVFAVDDRLGSVASEIFDLAGGQPGPLERRGELGRAAHGVVAVRRDRVRESCGQQHPGGLARLAVGVLGQRSGVEAAQHPGIDELADERAVALEHRRALADARARSRILGARTPAAR